MNTKHYTSIEMSKRLLELGLSPETADMWWTPLNWQLTEYYVEVKQNGIGTPKNPIPCWSTGALLELMPNITLDGDRFLPVLYIDGEYFTLVYQHMTTIFRSEYGKDIIVPIYKMMCYLLQNNYIKTE